MSDLISRKAVLDIINKHRCDTARIEEGVLNLPFAYDVDKVIEAINFKQYFDELYGDGLEIANWHLNGDLEPFDTFYESALEKGAVKE